MFDIWLQEWIRSKLNMADEATKVDQQVNDLDDQISYAYKLVTGRKDLWMKKEKNSSLLFAHSDREDRRSEKGSSFRGLIASRLCAKIYQEGNVKRIQKLWRNM